MFLSLFQKEHKNTGKSKKQRQIKVGERLNDLAEVAKMKKIKIEKNRKNVDRNKPRW